MKIVVALLMLFCIYQAEALTNAGQIKHVGDALKYGGWRTHKQIRKMSEDDKRNTLIVEMEKISSLSIRQLQSKSTNGRINSLVGMAAIAILLREMDVRSTRQLKSMSDDDQRNTLIVHLNKRYPISVSSLQAKGDLELVKYGASKVGSC